MHRDEILGAVVDELVDVGARGQRNLAGLPATRAGLRGLALLVEFEEALLELAFDHEIETEAFAVIVDGARLPRLPADQHQLEMLVLEDGVACVARVVESALGRVFERIEIDALGNLDQFFGRKGAFDTGRPLDRSFAEVQDHSASIEQNGAEFNIMRLMSRVLISADMEGITGVCHRDHLMAGGNDYERARRWLTADVNAAVEGALDGGATEVVVADGHATMRNVLLDELHPEAQLLCGPAQTGNRTLVQLADFGRGRFDRAMLIGYHTRAGTPGGLLSHTWVGALVHEIRLQGTPAGEARLNAAILGEWGTPVVFASGADDFALEVRADLGDDLEVAVVKRVLGPTGVISLSLAAAADRIRMGAARGMQAQRDPLRIEGAVTVELEFHRRRMAERGATVAGTRIDGRTLRFEAETVTQAIEPLWRALTQALSEEASFLQ